LQLDQNLKPGFDHLRIGVSQVIPRHVLGLPDRDNLLLDHPGAGHGQDVGVDALRARAGVGYFLLQDTVVRNDVRAKDVAQTGDRNDVPFSPRQFGHLFPICI
jgi:hypothetical protein